MKTCQESNKPAQLQGLSEFSLGFLKRSYRIHPWKKLGVQIEKLEFDLENLSF